MGNPPPSTTLKPFKGRCAGTPLEQLLDPEWWSKIFNEVYLKTDSDVVMNESLTKREVDLIIQMLDLEPSERILDLCCGQGRHSIELGRRGFRNVEGLDLSEYLVRLAQKTAREQGIKVSFRLGDARNTPYPNNMFDAVMLMGNSFGYFANKNDDIKVLREIYRVLRPYGRLLMDLAAGDAVRQNYAKRSWEWVDDRTLVVREREMSTDGERIITREIVIDVENGVRADNVYAVRLYSFAELKSILESAGFVNVTLRMLMDSEDSSSDPGLMATRMIVTALAGKENGEQEGGKEVYVLLGDPRIPNPVKPGSVFDEDDQYAVNELKSALYGIKGYKFKFIDNHSEMLRILEQDHSRIHLVLNLCDDGLHNDPFKEPHIPAMLDMLGLSYTGAGQRCLTLCYDKNLVKLVAHQMGIPTPRSVLLEPGEAPFRVRGLKYPLVVKPNFGDNSWGITEKSIARSSEDLVASIENLRRGWGYGGPILVEEYIEGEDLTVSIIGNPPHDYVVAPILREDYSGVPASLPRICTYQAKWIPASSYGAVRSVPASLPPSIKSMMTKWSIQLFKRLECRDYARFDWRLGSDGVPYFLEANPNPGWVWDGHLRRACSYMGWTYRRMLLEIIKRAERRVMHQQSEALAQAVKHQR
ncbi:MAG: methyltransferase domain-containing protein [Nitrososphaerota archaeon]